jgi:hypothetical protein
MVFTTILDYLTLDFVCFDDKKLFINPSPKDMKSAETIESIKFQLSAKEFSSFLRLFLKISCLATVGSVISKY